MLEAPLALARIGWPLLPLHEPIVGGCSCREPGCGSVGKHPRNWNGAKGATTSEQTLRIWWNCWPTANIGLATGGGRWVLDVDGPEGRDTLGRLEAEHGPLPATVSAITGSGGRHLFFAGGEGVKNRAAKYGEVSLPGLDTRSARGYVVAAPSLHATGGRYAWEAGCAVELAEAPAWLLALVTVDAKQATRGSERVSVALPPRQPPIYTGSTRQMAYVLTALELECERVESAQEGERNNTLNRAAFAVGRLLWALDANDAGYRLLAAAEACGLEGGEAIKTIRSGFRKGGRDPRDLPFADE